MAIEVVILYSLFLIFAGIDCQLTVKPDPEEVCVGSNVTLNWTYGDVNNFAAVTWTYIDSSSAEKTIMEHANPGTATVIGGYNVQHDGNGAITLTNVALSNTGAYKIAVAYTSATAAVEHNVSVTVRAPPAGLSASNTTTNEKITYTCILTQPGDPAANLYIQVNDVDKTSTVSDVVEATATVKCCVSGSSVECMSGVTSTVFCQIIQNGHLPPGPRCWCWCWWGCWYDRCDVCIICWIAFPLMIALILYLVGIIIGLILIKTSWCGKGCKDSDCCECCGCCGKNKYVTCACCASLLCVVCCNNAGLPFWVQVLWGTIIGTPVALGIYTVWKCCDRGNGNVDAKCEDPKFETQSGNTRTGQKKSEIKNKSKISAQTENEQGRKSREQPPIPLVAQTTETTMSGREDSDSAVSREHVKLQDSDRTLPLRPMPDIPRKSDRQGHDSKGRGLSANFSDDDHPLVSIDIPLQKKGALDALPEGTGGEEPVKKKKKKKKKQEEDEE